MLFAIIAVHVVTDFVLQPDWMATAKRQNMGVLALHALITGLGPIVLAWLIWPVLWAPAICLMFLHFLIDWAKIRTDHYFKGGPMPGFLLDQFFHLLSYGLVLGLFGLLPVNEWTDILAAIIQNQAIIFRYVFAYSMSIFFGYVLLKVMFAGHPVPQDNVDSHWVKYIGMFERGLITTFVALSQFPLIALVVAPRVVFKFLHLREPLSQQKFVYEILINIALAVGMGLLLR
ncbi:MAG: DUF3307 domain-containing protein [Anaerolineales bacterium]